MSKPPKHVIQLYAQPDFQVAGPALAALEKDAVNAAIAIQLGERGNSIRVILAGLALRRVKASLKHGKWEGWEKTNLRSVLGKAYSRTAQYWMQLADKFVDESQITVPDFLALPGTGVSPHVGDGKFRALSRRVDGAENMNTPKDHRGRWQPKFPEVAKQCASCPFRVGNDKEFGEVIAWLRVKFEMSDKVHRADIQHARFCVRIDAEHGDFVCHHTAYDGQMKDRPVTDYRQCAGATEAFRARVAASQE